MNEVISKLNKKRKDWLEVTKANNFDKGISNLLTELYPDNAHFIYELLQNAEDTGATIVNFELLKDKLIFTHNGRNFNEKDLEGITSIGQGTKKDDVNKIGKFGVGFKAVFSYTSTPIIHSGEYHFRIDDLVVPTEIEKIETIDKTIMIFPFNNPNKSPKNAFLEIKKGLENIKENTILFLNNIRKIEYSYLNEYNYIEREEIDNIRISIFNKKLNKYSGFLRFKKFLPNNNNLFVSVAFKIVIENNKIKVLPIQGKVFIFFPAEKETSNLKFHLHAPFASTVARDSIKDLQENIELISLITDLLKDVLEYMKENKLLNFDFIKCLPIQDDNLPIFYQPIMDKFIELFNNYPFVPVENDEFQPANLCYRSSKILKELFDVELLRKIQQKDNVFWIKNPNQNNSREDKFLNLLKIFEFGMNNIFNKLKLSFIQNKSDEWFYKFYSYLYDQIDKSMYFSLDKYKTNWRTFIKLSDNSLNKFGKKCYFSDFPVNNVLIVKKEVYDNKNNFKINKAKRFLEFLDVKEIDEKEKIKLILEKDMYHQQVFVETDELKVITNIEDYLNDFNAFLQYYEKYKDITIFQYKAIILDRNNILRYPEHCFINKNYLKTFKEIGYFENDEVFEISSIYSKLKRQEIFLEFITKLGVWNNLRIISKNVKNHPLFYKELYEADAREFSDSKIDVDFNIFNLDFLIEFINKEKVKEISLIIWNLMKNIKNNDYFYARYRPNKRYEEKIIESTLIYTLKNSTWIPAKDGNFYKPAEMKRELLSDEFIYDNRNGWLSAIEFGKNIHKKKKEYQELDKKLQEEFGIKLDILEEIKNANLTIEDLQEVLKLKKQQTLQEALQKNQGSGETKEVIQAKNDESIITNEKKYQEQVQKENENNQNDFQEAQTKYKKQDRQELKKIEQFLYKEYEGHCQICGDTFADNNKNVFEMKSLNIGENRDINRKGNTLCLCHKHHEIFKRNLQKNMFQENLPKPLNLDVIEEKFNKYDFVGREDINIHNDTFYRLPENDNFERDEVYFLPIKLFGRIEYIKFTKAHILEFIEVWNNF